MALNGTLLLLLVVLYVVGYKSIFAQIFSGNVEGQSYYFEQYFQENSGVMVVFGLLFLLLGLACVFLIYTFPVLYMKRLAETGDPNITSNQLLADFKKHIWKFIKFVVGMFIIMLPLTAILMTISFFLMFIIIGFFLLILLFPALANVVNLTLFHYFNTNNGFFASLSYGFKAQFSYSNKRIKSPFWKYWASSLVMYMIVQTVSSVLIFIPMVIMGVSVLTVPTQNEPEAMKNFFNGGMGILFFVFYAISILCSFVLMNANYINAGLIYYDSRLDLHRNEDFTEIESIGVNEI
ncbi:DUF4013 domain-containing protein [Halpernia sp.]|uniref:DUF4013 domain-containing protein n=1 Tax=Halpernia sp. TaxID=2782209 RepID=UPI003A9285A5